MHWIFEASRSLENCSRSVVLAAFERGRRCGLKAESLGRQVGFIVPAMKEGEVKLELNGSENTSAWEDC